MTLSREEREAFLAQPHVAALGVAAGPSRGPLLVPIWYGYRPGGLPWILTGANSRKLNLIKASGRFSLLVERSEPTPRYVSVEGPVADIAEPGPTAHRDLAARYLRGEDLTGTRYGPRPNSLTTSWSGCGRSTGPAPTWARSPDTAESVVADPGVCVVTFGRPERSVQSSVLVGACGKVVNLRQTGARRSTPRKYWKSQ